MKLRAGARTAVAVATLGKPPAAGVRLAVSLVVAGALLAGCGGSGSVAADPAAIAVSGHNCGAALTAEGGTRTILLHNTDTVTVGVDLVDPATGGVYAEVESMGPGTTVPMRVTLTPGSYALRCLADGADAVTGPTVRVRSGPPTGDAAVLPVTEQDLAGPVKTYRAYVTSGLATLVGDVTVLRAAVGTGDRADAEGSWLTAHLAYERLGAAYDTFDDFADKIDGRPDGLPGGVDDPDFTGFRRIEYGLWHGQSVAGLAPIVDQLGADVAGLRLAFPGQQTDPNDLPLRAHEILENALQFELSGSADQGSGTGLATIDANLDGTRAVLDAIKPIMRPRYPGWSTVDTQLGRTRELIEAQDHGGTWTAPAALTTADRQRIDGAVGQLLETLAPIAAIGDVRRTS
jgi:iron uptake system EfeUOB component EfeO/EfeM